MLVAEWATGLDEPLAMSEEASSAEASSPIVIRRIRRGVTHEKCFAAM